MGVAQMEKLADLIEKKRILVRTIERTSGEYQREFVAC
jgi:hypothetical protein